MDKKASRLRRARQTRAKIAELKVNRLAVHRTNLHIYATIISPDAKVLASASTAEADVRKELARAGIEAQPAGPIRMRIDIDKAPVDLAPSRPVTQGFHCRTEGRVRAQAAFPERP